MRGCAHFSVRPTLCAKPPQDRKTEMQRIKMAFKLFWFGLTHPELFISETVFKNMASILEHTLMVSEKDRPFTTHLFLGKNRLVSFWMYPGLNKNPVDRITELIGEVEALKEVAVQHTTSASTPLCSSCNKSDMMRVDPLWTCGRCGLSQ